jgi:hypothetical protein
MDANSRECMKAGPSGGTAALVDRLMDFFHSRAFAFISG